MSVRQMFAPLMKCGQIEDTTLGLNWNRTTLVREVERRAAVLSQMGIGRGSTVTIAHNNSARFFADLFATWSVGATAACLDPTLTPGELRNVVHFTKSPVLLVDAGITIDNLSAAIVELNSARPASAATVTATLNLDDPALVLFTSGTTGAPKGVVLSFRSLLARINKNIAMIGRGALRRTLVALPTHFGHGLIGNSLTPLLAGCDIVLAPLGISLASNLARVIDKHDISFMCSVATQWRMTLAHSRRPAGGSLVRVHIGSAPLSAALWSQVVAWSDAEVVNCYGITETGNWIAGASSRVEGVAEGLGAKLWGGSAAVIDESGSILNVGAGEIIIKSPFLMSGYFDRPDLTAAAFNQGWFRTGDRGSIDSQGRIWLTGRIKDEINRAGFKVQPAEVDAVLESNPAVAEACVFGIEDPVGGEAVAAAIRLASGAVASPLSLQAWCRERLRIEAVPEHWFFVSDIPRTARGKVSREVVRRMLAEDPLGDALKPDLAKPAFGHEVPSNAETARFVRNAVDRAWTEILGHDSFTADSPLNESGDSLDALRLWLSIEKFLGTPLSMDALDLEITPSRLTAVLDQQLRTLSCKPSLESGYPRAPLIFFMTGAGGDEPLLARFRALLKDKIRFGVIEYPSWRKILDVGADPDALSDAVIAQICAQSSEEDLCLLAGFSFGGLVALETANRLMERGRRVGFLGLIDTRFPDPPRERRGLLIRARSKLRSIFVRPREELSLRGIIATLTSNSVFPLLKIMGKVAMLLPGRHAFAIEHELKTQLRTNLLFRSQLKHVPVPTTLFRSDEMFSVSPDYGWRAKCSQLAVIPIGGTHHSMLEPPRLDNLCARFLEAVEASVKNANLKPFGSRESNPLAPDTAFDAGAAADLCDEFDAGDLGGMPRPA